MASGSENLEKTLQAFEDYALKLQPLVGGLQKLEEALLLLLPADGRAALLDSSFADASKHASFTGHVVTWCFRDGGNLGAGPAAVARATSAESLKEGVAWRQQLLDCAPKVLATAGPLVSRRLGQVVARLLSEASARAWLSSLGQRSLERSFEEADALDRTEADSMGVADPALRAFATGAAAILERSPAVELCADVWSVTRQAMLDHDSAERRVCVQQLLPALVAVSPAEVSASHISEMVSGLFRPGTDEGLALNLATAFAGLLVDHWKLSSLQGDHEPLAVALISQGLRFGLKECGSLRKQARFLLEKALVAKTAEGDFRSHAGIGLSSLSSAWRSFWELFDTLEDGRETLKSGPARSLLLRGLLARSVPDPGLGSRQRQRAEVCAGAADVSQHPQGPDVASSRLLEALFDIRAVHFTPIRLVLSALQQAELPHRSWPPRRALEIAQRPGDAVFAALRPALARLAPICLALDRSASAACLATLLQSLVSSYTPPVRDSTVPDPKPMEAVPLAMGTVRLLSVLCEDAFSEGSGSA
eukprot:s2656_g1.t1